MSRAVILVLMAAVWPSGCSESAESVAPAQPSEPLAIEQVQPPEGHTGGGPFATIVGSGFDTHTAIEVRFGDTLSPRTAVIGSSRLQVEIPPGTEGPVTVTVRQGTRVAELPSGFRYTGSAEHEEPR